MAGPRPHPDGVAVPQVLFHVVNSMQERAWKENNANAEKENISGHAAICHLKRTEPFEFRELFSFFCAKFHLEVC